MKTTLNIADPVMQRLRAEAVRRGVTMSHLVETALRILLDRPADSPPALAPMPKWEAGLLVDVADRDALYRSMEGR